MNSNSAAKLIAIYSIIVGVFMFVFWALLLITDQVAPSEKPWAISFHLAGEWGTAFLLIMSGAGLWRGSRWARIISPLGLGMLLYSVIVSPGYYAQAGNLPMVAMFAVLIILTIAAIVGQFKLKSET